MPQMTVLQAVNSALRDEMRLNSKICVLGEDVGFNGGVFRATEGLQKEFGEERCFDTPLSEDGIIGTAIGMAMYGARPVAEIQFQDFIWPAFDQIVSEMSKMRYRSGGQYTVPLVVRTPYGGGIKGGHYHSQSGEAYFAHTPGLTVVVPSTPYDIKGLLISAMRAEDPIIFLEPKRIYRSVKGEVPEGVYTVPLGEGIIRREGKHVTVVCYGAMMHTVMEASDRAAEQGIEVEVVDLRTIYPLDEELILNSVRKTGRAVVAYEAPKTSGFGAEIAATIAEKAVEYLEAPILRVAGFDTPYPYSLEHIYMPDAKRVFRAIEKVYKF